MNHIDKLHNMSDEEISKLDIQEIISIQNDFDILINGVKEEQQRLNDIISQKYREKLDAVRKLQNKKTGTVNIKDGQWNIKSNVPKNVKWDASVLKGIYEDIKAKGNNPDDWMSISFKVSETKYKAFPDKVKKRFNEARTVEEGSEKIEVVFDGGE